MGKHNENIRINLGFTADTSKAKTQLQDLQASLTKIVNMPASKFGTQISTDLSKAKLAAAELKLHLEQATNVETGRLDFSKLDQSLRKSNISLVQYADTIRRTGPEGEKAFMQIANAVVKAEVPIRRSNALVNELWISLKNTARWQISSSILHGFMRSISSAVGYAQDLNESLNNIRIVTGQNTDQMAKFAEQANKAARQLSTTTTEYTNASLIYYQQGLSDEEVAKRTEVTIKMANAAGTSAQEVSNQLTAVWNNFYDGSKSLEYYADVMTALGAATASSTDEISQGLNKFAAVAETVGLSYEYATSALATVTATTRESADVVGTAFKTLFARIQGLQLGETQDDGTNLNKYSEALDKVGIKIKDTNGEMKDMDTILNELGSKWQTLSKDTQTALAQTVAGVRQYTQLVALMDNWSYFQENLGVASSASGTLNEQSEIYAESWEAARDRVKTALESIYSSLLDDDAFINILNFIEKFLVGIDRMIDAMGGFKGVLATLSTVLLNVFSTQISQSINGMMASTKIGQQMIQDNKRAQVQSLVDSMSQGDSYASKVYSKRIELQQKFLDNESRLSASDKQIVQQMGDNLEIAQDRQIQAHQKKLAASQELTNNSFAFNVSQIEDDASIKKKSLTAQIENKQAQIQTAQADGTNAFNVQNMYTELQQLQAELQKVDTQIPTTKNSIDEFKSSLKGLAQTDYNLSSLSQLFNIDDNGEKVITDLEEARKVASSLTKDFEDSREALAMLNKTGFDIDDAEVQRLQELLSEINQELINPTGVQNADMLGNKVAEAQALQTQLQDAIKRTGSEAGLSTTMMDKYVTSTKNLARAKEEEKRAVDDAAQAQKNYEAGLKGNTKFTADFGKSLTSFASSLTSISSAWHSLNGAINALKNPDLTGMEKFMSVMSSAAQGTLMLVNATASASAAVKALDLANFKSNLTLGLNTVAKMLNAKAEEDLAEKKLKTAAASKAKGEALDQESQDLVENTVANEVNKKSQNSPGGSPQNGADPNSLGAAWKNFGSALKGAIGPILAIAGAVAIIAVVVGAATAEFNKEAEAAKNASIQSEQAAAAYEETVNKYNELTSNISSYQNAVKGIEEMEKGTLEWREAIANANDEALKLLETYDNLEYSINNDGLIEIDEESLQKAQEEALDQKRAAQARKIAAEQYSSTKSLEQNRTQFARETLKSNADAKAHTANIGVTTAAGAGAGALIGSAIPVIGTAIGAAVGAGVGLIGGAVTAALGGADSEKEQRALDKLVDAYQDNSAAVEAAFAGNEESLRAFLTQKLNIKDEGLINSLVENKNATLDLIESEARLTETMQAQNQLYVDAVNSTNDAYKNSEAAAYAAYSKSKEIGTNEPTESEVNATIEEMFGGAGDDYSRYIKYLEETQGGKYQVIHQNGYNATLQRMTDQGTWETVGDENTLTQEQVATEVLKYEKALISESDLEKAEQTKQQIENQLLDIGITQEQVSEQALKYFQEGTIDLSKMSKDTVESIKIAAREITDLDLKKAVINAVEGYTESFELFQSQKDLILSYQEISKMELRTNINEEQYNALGSELQGLFKKNLDGTYTLVKRVTSIDNKMSDSEDEDISIAQRNKYVNQITSAWEDLYNDTFTYNQAKRGIEGLPTELQSYTNDDLIAALGIPSYEDWEGKKENGRYYKGQSLYSSYVYQQWDKLYAKPKIESLKTYLRTIGYTDNDFIQIQHSGYDGGKISQKAFYEKLMALMPENADEPFSETVNAHYQTIASNYEEWSKAIGSEDELNYFLSLYNKDKKFLENNPALEYTVQDEDVLRENVQQKEALALGLDLTEWENFAGVLAKVYPKLAQNEDALKRLATTYFELSQGVQQLSNDFTDLMAILNDPTATKIQKQQTLQTLQQILDKMFEGDLHEGVYDEQFFKNNEDVINSVIAGDEGSFQQLKTALLMYNAEHYGSGANSSEFAAVLTELEKQDKTAGRLTTEEFREAFLKWVDLGQSEEDVEAALRLMGYDASVIRDADGQIQVNWNQVQYQDTDEIIKTVLNSIQSQEKRDEVDLIELKDEITRYKEIDDVLDDITRSYTKANAAADKFYGTNRIENLRKANEKLLGSIDAIDKKQSEANNYLVQDRADLQTAVKKATSRFELQFDENGNLINYDELMKNAVTNLQKAQKRYNSGKGTEEDLEEAQKAYDELKEALSKYDETRELIEDLDDEKESKLLEWQTNNLTILTESYENASKKIDKAAERIKYNIEDIADEQNQIAELGALYAASFESIEDSNELINSKFDEAAKSLASGEINQAQFLQIIETLQADLQANLDNAKQLKEQMLNYYEEAFNTGSEAIEKYTDRIEHLMSVTEHYQNMLGILGKETDYAYLDSILTAQSQIATNQRNIAQQNYETARNNADKLKAQLALAPDDETLKANWEAAEKIANEKQQEYLDATEAWAEAYAAILDNTLNKAAQTLENMFTGGGSFDQLNSKLERAKSLQEEYLTTTNQIYETTKLMRTAQNAIDETTNTVAKAKLKSYIQETEQLQKQTKLSQYELDIQQAKYDLILAEIALEEAQNAKSTVRLRRDAEGNFGYVYTADENAVNEARQKYEDAENALYNKGLEGANDYAEKYEQTMSEMYDTLTELNQKYREGEFESEAEYNEAVRAAKEYYYQQLENYSALYATAVDVDSRIIEDAWSSSFANMIDSTEEWKNYTEDYLLEVAKAFKDFYAQTDGLLPEESVLGKLANDAGKIAEETETMIADLSKELTEAVGKIVNTFRELVVSLNTIIEQNRESLGLGDKNGFVLGDEVKYKDKNYIIYNMSGNSASIIDENGNIQTVDVNNLQRYSSGGYTGNWSDSSGRLGILDKKEIILNAHDTENFLASLDLMRDIIRVIDLQAASAQFDNILSSGHIGYANSGTLEQNVKIEASFPNVTDHNEIEEAFNNLINTASQYAYR